MSEVMNSILGKITISGKIKLLTGLHIGASQENLQIGGVDSPVIRDALSHTPYIPGSSFRGKLRSTLEKIKKGQDANFDFDRYSGQNVYRHECTDITCPVCRLFGATGQKREEKNIPARLSVRDIFLTSKSIQSMSNLSTGLLYSEVKFENSLDRITASANPRQIERVPAGAEFEFNLVYNVESDNSKEVVEDLQNLFMLLEIVQDDAIGGHGSRGYGRIEITEPELSVKKVDYYSALDEQQKNQAIKTISAESIQKIKESVNQITDFVME